MATQLNRKSDNIKLPDRIGTWYVIDETVHLGRRVFLLQHEQLGDETEALAVLEDGRIICEEIYDDWLGHLDEADLNEMFTELDWQEYLAYLVEWVHDHSEPQFARMSPAHYFEWYDNERAEFEEEN
jgi:hypothetical protein